MAMHEQKTRRLYYSSRTKSNSANPSLDLPLLKQLFRATYLNLQERHYFQQALGYSCVDSGRVYGTMGSDIDAYFFRRLRKRGLWPVDERIAEYTEEDLFDVIELLHDHVSKPVSGYYHSFGDCGMHYSAFDSDAGRCTFRNEVNEVLLDYNDGYELSCDGEILCSGEPGLENLLKAALPQHDPTNINARVDLARRKFTKHHSSLEDRREAVRSLAEVLEYLRPELGTVISRKDEADLFNIANNFGIRHHNEKQKTDYDQAIWLDWMFYYFLSTIHAVTRLLQNSAASTPPPTTDC